MFKFNSLDNEDDGSYNPEKFLLSFNTIHGYVSEKLLKKKGTVPHSYYALWLHILTHLPAAAASWSCIVAGFPWYSLGQWVIINLCASVTSSLVQI